MLLEGLEKADILGLVIKEGKLNGGFAYSGLPHLCVSLY